MESNLEVEAFMTGRMHGSAQKKETEQVAWVRIILSILSLGYDVNLG